MSSRPSIPSMDYHQTHTVYGLPACPLCGWKSLIIRSYGRIQEPRTYYVSCEHCCDVENGGTMEGPRRGSAEEAGKAFNTAMQKFSASFQEGRGGEYDQ